MPTVADVVTWVEREFPPELAESWDAVGLVCGRPEAPVAKIVVTVDVTEEVVAAALADGADFLLAHHPLLLSGVNSISATDFKGRILHQLIEAGCALMTAHTNADAADPGVSDALAAAVGLTQVRPLQAFPQPARDKVTVFVPDSHATAVLDSMADAGAGQIDAYDRCAYWVQGEGTFRPLVGSDPYLGKVGEIENVTERRLEMLSPRNRTQAVIAAMMAAHPYEVPALDVVELVAGDSTCGLGRIGRPDKPMTLRAFSELVAQSLPATAHGVRVAGDDNKEIRTVAVCAGSGDSLLELADAAGADVYLTSDLKHHRVSDHVGQGGCAVVDVAHWASEFPWCEQVAGALRAGLNVGEDTVTVEVARIVTDPWDHQLRSAP